MLALLSTAAKPTGGLAWKQGQNRTDRYGVCVAYQWHDHAFHLTCLAILRLPSARLYALIAMNRIIPNPTNIAPSESLAKLVRVIEALCVS